MAGILAGFQQSSAHLAVLGRPENVEKGRICVNTRVAITFERQPCCAAGCINLRRDQLWRGRVCHTCCANPPQSTSLPLCASSASHRHRCTFIQLLLLLPAAAGAADTGQYQPNSSQNQIANSLGGLMGDQESLCTFVPLHSSWMYV